MNWKISIAVVTFLTLAIHPAGKAAIVLFADDFSNGAIGAAVSINDPDPLVGPETVADNTSVSGAVLNTFSDTQRPWAGDNAAGGHLGGEAGGIASWQQGGAGSGTITPTFDFATHSSLMNRGEFTVFLGELDPVADGDTGVDADWAALSLFRPLPNNGGGTEVNNNLTGLGILFRDSGQLQVFSAGTNILGDTVFDAAPTGETYDVAVEITNISGFGPGNSFDYDVIVDGNSITSGNLTGIDTTNAFVALETRNESSTIGQITVSSVPEPSSLAMAGLLLGLAAVGASRRRRLK